MIVVYFVVVGLLRLCLVVWLVFVVVILCVLLFDCLLCFAALDVAACLGYLIVLLHSFGFRQFDADDGLY